MNSRRKSLRPDTHSLTWLAVAAVTLVACGDEALSSVVTRASPLTATHRGADVEAHPVYARLSDELSDGIAVAFREIAALPHSERDALQEEVAVCTGGDGPGCETLLAGLGFPSARLQQIQRDGARIVRDLGLPVGEVVPAFTDAQFLHEGAGDESELVSVVLSAGVTCGAVCQEYAGNSLGAAKGQTGGSLGLSLSLQPFHRSALAELIERIRDIIIIIDPFPWVPRPECFADSDCPRDEYCHRLGFNDCRPRRSNGALCTRDAQCASGRCVPHISNFFLPTCRP